ncbi:hypothetical protein N7495_007921 [Penicillium taxi]|uniref:uncharacterized protein n=1 Tax=Penicillium taxi TaxID=168475 RepID=UPI00254516E3|nr:uncharacterized protein N7495_007921 [Penicillium taxi]KAJ5887880.1 hypothetical protein N7495_007921 [Penicillium taxi]
MRLNKGLISALLAPAALATTNADTVFSGFENLHKRILSTQDCIKSFDGGVVQSLSCGFELYNVLTASGSARKDLADLDSVPPDQVQAYLNHYHGIRLAVSKTLETASSRIDNIDSAGLKIFAQVLVRHFGGEREVFETLTKSKLPASSHSEIAGPIDSLKDEFENAFAVFV